MLPSWPVRHGCAHGEQLTTNRRKFVTVVIVIAFLELLGRLAAATLGAALSASSPASIIAIAGVAGAIGIVAVVAGSGIRAIVANAMSLRVRERLGRPIEPADRALLISQSDPDADGHPRPRAPGYVLQTA